MSATTIAVAGAAVAGGAVAATQIADNASELKFSGTFSGTLTGSFISRNGADSCSFTRAVSASAQLKFDEQSDSSVRGKFEYDGGTGSFTSNTCGNPFTMPNFIGQVDLTGSPSRFSGRQVINPPATSPRPGETITGEHIYTFEGSISGDTATGTFKYEQKSLSTGGGGGDVQQFEIGMFTMTFQKS